VRIETAQRFSFPILQRRVFGSSDQRFRRFASKCFRRSLLNGGRLRRTDRSLFPVTRLSETSTRGGTTTPSLYHSGCDAGNKARCSESPDNSNGCISHPSDRSSHGARVLAGLVVRFWKSALFLSTQFRHLRLANNPDCCRRKGPSSWARMGMVA